jgi:hypothetical protein
LVPLRGFLNAALTLFWLLVVLAVFVSLYLLPAVVAFFSRHPAAADVVNFSAAGCMIWRFRDG